MAITVPNAVPAVVKAVNLDNKERISWNFPRLKVYLPAPLVWRAPPGQHGKHGWRGDTLAQTLTQTYILFTRGTFNTVVPNL